MYMSGVNKTYETRPLEYSAGNIISQGFLMADDQHVYFRLVFTREEISSLQVPDANFQEVKSDYFRAVNSRKESLSGQTIDHN